MTATMAVSPCVARSLNGRALYWREATFAVIAIGSSSRVSVANIVGKRVAVKARRDGCVRWRSLVRSIVF